MKVRPITVMAGLAALVALAAVTVAWLPGHHGSTVGQPSSLPISLGYGTASAMAPVSTIAGLTTYVRGPGLADLSPTQAAWTFSKSATNAPPAVVGSLARALGVSGAVRTVAGGWQVGPEAGPALHVSSNPGFNWTYDRAMASGGVGCTSVSSPPDVGSDSTPSVTAPWMRTTMPRPSASTTAPPSSCEVPAPPAGVPDQVTAEAVARRVLRAAGLDPSKLEWHTTADAWTATATATPVLDGTSTLGIDTTISFGGLAAIDYASGWLGSPTKTETYPLIGIDVAIDRLNRGVDLLGPQMMGPPEPANGIDTQIAPAGPAEPAAPPPVVPGPTMVMPPTTVPDPSSGSGGGSVVSAEPGGPGPGPTYVPEAVPTPDPIHRTVTISSSTVVLVARPGEDGTTWLVPAYELRSAGDATGRWLVLGVDESFVAPPGPKDTAIPPASGGPGSSPGSPPTVETIPGSTKPCPPADADPNAAWACPAQGIDAMPPTTGTIQPR